MPLEGQWERTQTPLRRLTRRERGAAIALVAVTAVALAGLLLFTAGDSRPGPAPGCISVPIPGRTGAELVNGCGIKAREICARAATRDDPGSRAIAAECAERRIPRLAPSAGRGTGS
jgi:hypothetical protein